MRLIMEYKIEWDGQMTIEKLQKELRVLDERKKAVKAVQSLKQKQIALILQSLADVQATVHEVGAGTTNTIYAAKYREQKTLKAGKANTTIVTSTSLGSSEPNVR